MAIDSETSGSDLSHHPDCPDCGQPLLLQQVWWKCPDGHTFWFKEVGEPADFFLSFNVWKHRQRAPDN